MKGSTLLKVTSILQIIGGAILLIFGVLALVAAMVLMGNGYGAIGAIVLIGSIILIISPILQLVAGILGVANCKKPEKAGVCVAFGFIIIALSIIGNIIKASSGDIDVVSIIIGLIVPVLYLVGAIQLKSNLTNPVSNDAPVENPNDETPVE